MLVRENTLVPLLPPLTEDGAPILASAAAANNTDVNATVAENMPMPLLLQLQILILFQLERTIS